MPASESRLQITFGLISESVQSLALQYVELLRLRKAYVRLRKDSERYVR